MPLLRGPALRAVRRPPPSAVAHRCRRGLASDAAPGMPLVTTELDASTGVAVITLNQPDKMNAMTVDMGVAFETAVAELCLEPPTSLKACVLTGAGRAFSAGGDLKFLMDRHNDSPTNNASIMRSFYSRFLSLRKLEVPVIAAINGPAIGAGMAVACACDLRVAAPDAKMGITFVGLGLPPGMGSTHWLPSIIGPQRAAELILTGEVIEGTEAAARGLVLKTVENPLAEALNMAGKIAEQGPLAVRAAVRAMRLAQEQQGGGIEAALRREADVQASVYGSADLREGVAALQERRKPTFSGR